MTKLIAIAGKGGVGKTTLSAIFTNRLIANNCSPVLAVDADPNICLDEVLGVTAEKTIGAVREEAREIASKGLSVGVSKQELLEMKISESLVEAEDFDLIAMGRCEGPGCYCYANNVLKNVIQEIAGQYPFVVLDNEAGLENLSRRIVQKVDVFIMVSDSSKRGINTVSRLYDLALEMGIEFEKSIIFINRCRDGKLPTHANSLKEKCNTENIIPIPDNTELADFAEEGTPLTKLSTTNPVIEIIDNAIKNIII